MPKMSIEGNNKDSIKGIVMRIVQEHLGISGDKLSPDAHIEDDLGLDSLDLQELILMVEKRFGIGYPDEKITSIERISDIVAFLQQVLPRKKKWLTQSHRRP